MTSDNTHRLATGRESADAFVVGPRLIAAGAEVGPLAGRTFAVKDLFDVAGIRTGAGNPDYLAAAAPAAGHAPAVAALLAAGADLVGKTVTDGATASAWTRPQAGVSRAVTEFVVQHGDWYRAHSGSFGAGVGARLAAAAAVTAGQAQQARDERASFAAAFGTWLGTGTYLVQPTAAGPAPLITSDDTERLRLRTHGLTASAGLSGAPALSLPLARSAGLPLGVCVVGRPGDDDALAELAVRALPSG